MRFQIRLAVYFKAVQYWILSISFLFTLTLLRICEAGLENSSLRTGNCQPYFATSCVLLTDSITQVTASCIAHSPIPLSFAFMDQMNLDTFLSEHFFLTSLQCPFWKTGRASNDGEEKGKYFLNFQFSSVLMSIFLSGFLRDCKHTVGMNYHVDNKRTININSWSWTF